ncbi:MAG: hypothetical protein ACI35Q_09525 [Marinilabiliaceae bacterium]
MYKKLTMGLLVELPESATHVRVSIAPDGYANILDYGSPEAMDTRKGKMFTHWGEPGYSQAVLTREEAMTMAQTMLADTPTPALARLAEERDRWNALRRCLAREARLLKAERVADELRAEQIRRNQDRLIAITRNRTTRK